MASMMMSSVTCWAGGDACLAWELGGLGRGAGVWLRDFRRFRLEGVQMIARFLGVGGGLEDGPFVLLQNLEPMVEVGGVVVAGLRGDAEVAAEKRGPDLGDQFFAGIALVAELPASEIPVEAGRVLRPVSHLVGQRRAIALGILEGHEGRHLHVIGLRGVIGLVAAVADVGPGVGEERSAASIRCTGSSCGAAVA